MTRVAEQPSNSRADRPARSTQALLTGLACTLGAFLALGGCANGSGQVVSRLPASNAIAPPPPPQTLPPARQQQQRYNEVDKQALAASERAMAAENAAKLMPAPSQPITNVYNGYSRW